MVATTVPTVSPTGRWLRVMPPEKCDVPVLWPASSCHSTGAIRTLLRTGHSESAVLPVRSALNRRLPAPENWSYGAR
ncbi:hypothetical protein OG481_01175 [Streptomyces longwoodensis]|uniref:hypothetical protein n=1 Tax=Streptomyces longwoodensis TaxID=68231 RepID=UPI0022518F5B|nr:hypothetical protein [Streptomyces longwoodensis]MCX4999660.1 hypothetical protein [Streptomyces longwoodensis]WRY87212.1 hypothetical protein OG481_01175 [Streptomyces longwoodensis]WTI48394.1 hypothetical protein OG547_29660 [Streptomyces longwoodensis]